MIKSNLKLSKLVAKTLLPLRTPLATAFYETQSNTYGLAADSYKIDLFYTPSQSFAKMTKKKEEKMEHKKEREQTEVPKEIDLNKQEKLFTKALENFKVSFSFLQMLMFLPKRLKSRNLRLED